MTKEEYKAKKLEELHREFPSVWDGKIVQEFLESFLSQTIDELYGCLPEREDFKNIKEICKEEEWYERGYNACLSYFKQQLDKK